ncbi:MAG TPA: efflux RND transporter periplasmic adaptor subunit [Caulobacteraceae bacterium]|nr:efflux RND transporter periplasmic adaptor subunit [Caulobacteraceae bacterium]
MKRSSPWRYVAVAVIAVIVVFVAWKILEPKSPAPDAPAPSALVTLAPLRQATVIDTVRAYGVISGSPAASLTVAAPREVIVQRVLVTPGQSVAGGAPLVTLADTPATQLIYRQAADAAAFAERELARVQRLYDTHLAANDQLAAARKALADAKAVVASQSAAGAGRDAQTLTAPVAGVIGAIPAALGGHLAAGAPLLTVIAAGGMVADLGVEPTRAALLAVGQPVVVISVFDRDRHFDSRVAVVGRQVDPTTRLVRVTAPAPSADLALGAAVEGQIAVASHPGLLAPHQAVVYDETGAHVFTLHGGKAHEVSVKTGAQQGDDIEVTGALFAGELVVVQGAYQVQEGLAVRTVGK